MSNLFARRIAGFVVLVAAVPVTLAIAALAGGLASVRADSGGPSGSGYVWLDNKAPEPATTFAWIDATGGTRVASFVDHLGDPNADDGRATLPLPFTFDFFNTDYTELDIGTNGLLSFDIGNACNRHYNWNHIPIPHDDADCSSDGWGGNPLVASWFDDLDPDKCGDVYYDTFGSPPDRAFVVQFEDVCHNDCVDCESGEGITFETILFEDSNEIKVQYMDAFFGTGDDDLAEENNGGTATTGISLSGSTGLQYSYNTPALTDGLAVLYTKQQPLPSSTPTPTPKPALTHSPAPPPAAAAAPSPSSTPAVAAVVQMPETGGESPHGGSGGLAWLATIAGAVAATGTGALWFAKRCRPRA